MKKKSFLQVILDSQDTGYQYFFFCFTNIVSLLKVCAVGDSLQQMVNIMYFIPKKIIFFRKKKKAFHPGAEIYASKNLIFEYLIFFYRATSYLLQSIPHRGTIYHQNIKK